MVYHYSSERLEYRAIRQADANFFAALTDDTIGFINSSFSNIHVPNESDTSEAMKYYLEKCLLGVVIWLKHPANLSIEDRKKRVANAKEEGKEHMVEMWGESIGELHLSSLGPKHVQHRNTEIGLDILPEWQGKGYGSEAINWALDYAFRLAGLHRVRIRAFEFNDGAVKLYQKLGFVLEGREREAVWHEGRFWDGIEYSMLEGEWKALAEKKNQKEGEKEVVKSS